MVSTAKGRGHSLVPRRNTDTVRRETEVVARESASIAALYQDYELARGA